MTKLLPLTLFAALSFASCKKVYVCECKSTTTYPGASGSTRIENTPKMKKEDAKTWCNQGDQTINSVYFDIPSNSLKNYTITGECELK